MSYTDDYSNQNSLINSPATHSAAVTPHDTNEITPLMRALHVGTSGDIKGKLSGDDDFVTFPSVPVGVFPMRFKVIHTDTTASGLVAVW